MFGAALSRAMITDTLEGPVIVTVLSTKSAEGPAVVSPTVVRLIVCGPGPGILNVIDPPEQTSLSACRNEPAPLSAVVVTTPGFAHALMTCETAFEVDPR